MRVSIEQYYQSFMSIYGAFAAMPFLPLVMHVIIPDSSTLIAYLYPPLGDFQILATMLTILLLLFSTLLVYLWRRSGNLRAWVPASLLLGMLFGSATLALYVRYVRQVPIPSIGIDVTVSIGYQRTELALKTYPQWNDWQILHDRGPWEEQIQQMWTPTSIAIVRISLWLSYTITLGLMVAAASLGCYEYAAEQVVTTQAGIPNSP
jgi:hypothetical protein